MGENIKIGDKLYNWRYGELTVTEVDSYITTLVNDQEGIVKTPCDPKNLYLFEKYKEFRIDSIGKYLFLKPKDVLYTNSIFSIEDFNLKIHRYFKNMNIRLEKQLNEYITKLKKLENEKIKIEETFKTANEEIKQLEAEQTPSILKKNQPKIEDLRIQINNTMNEISVLDKEIHILKEKISDKQKELDEIVY